MTSTEDEAICIRHWDFSETSQTVGLFSRTHGLIRAIAKGSRRERGGFSGGVDLLSRATTTTVIKPGTDLATLTDWSLLENFPNIRKEMRANKIAYFAADLVGRLFEAHDPHPNMYAAFVHLLRYIGSGGESPKANSEANDELRLLDFQWVALCEAGFQPILGACQTGIDVVHFDPRDGGRVVENQTSTSWRVRVATITILEELRTGTRDTTHNEESVIRANRLLAAYIRDSIGEEPFTMRRLFGVLT